MDGHLQRRRVAVRPAYNEFISKLIDVERERRRLGMERSWAKGDTRYGKGFVVILDPDDYKVFDAWVRKEAGVRGLSLRNQRTDFPQAYVMKFDMRVGLLILDLFTLDKCVDGFLE